LVSSGWKGNSWNKTEALKIFGIALFGAPSRSTHSCGDTELATDARDLKYIYETEKETTCTRAVQGLLFNRESCRF